MPRAARTLAAVGMTLALLVASTTAVAAPDVTAAVGSAPGVVSAQGDATRTMQVPVGTEPDGREVSLDVDLYRPDTAGPWPAVILAHGFGGDKDDLIDQASALTEGGYLTLAYTARGFGESGGSIHLDDPAYEIADARALINLVAEQPDVQLDEPGDPRVGMAGGSYGGALALMTAGADSRVDSVVASITWHDLADAFFPQSAQAPGQEAAEPSKPIDQPGPFKAWWASSFFVGAQAGSPGEGDGPDQAAAPAEGAGSATAAGQAALCGRFDPQVCRLFLGAAETGQADPELLKLLAAHSPAPTLADVEAPVYLAQGMSDTLFGIDQADANARALQEAGVPVAVSWFNGGHDGATQAAAPAEEDGPPGDAQESAAADPDAQQARQQQELLTWLDGTLAAETPATQDTLPLPAFSYALPPAGPDGERVVDTDSYPPAGPDSGRTLLALSPAGPSALVNPPGGVPQATTALPGVGGLLAGLPTYPLSALPGQSVAFDSEPLTEELTVVGAPRLDLEVTSTGPTSTFFVSLWQVRGGAPTLPRRLVAPVQVDLTPGAATPVQVDLPGGTWEMPAGSTWRVLLTATDAAYRGPTAARADQITVTGAGLSVPFATGTPTSADSIWDTETIGVAVALLALLLLLGAAALRRRIAPHPVRDDLTDVPLVVQGLVKEFPDGHRAVDDVSWRAEQGQVVGLLGPNGAGKTTTLRMVMGLIRSDAGSVHVLGRPVYAGAPVLGRVGALVEGPGFLPHLTGLENLRAYWAATGRPIEEAHLDEALDIAALGDAVDRPVKAYSQGMRQRLGIAQAMLGMPEVLILDEPTNGLDPPQIAAMRPMLARYAEGGRTVVVSSHLLAEVEMTCSHVVVMHAGKVLAAGSVAEVGVEQGRNLEDVFLSTIAGVGSGEHLNRVRAR